jgi:hypothetical protein
MAKFEGRGQCDSCKRGVDVHSNKNGLAYYNCGPCGFRGQHMNRRTSDAVLAKLDRSAIEDGGPAPAKPAPAAAKPANPPAAAPGVPPPKPNPPAPPADPTPPKPGFLSNFTLP